MSHPHIIIPPGSPWIVYPAPQQTRSLFGSIRKIGRKGGNPSQQTVTSTTTPKLQIATTPSFRDLANLTSYAQASESPRRNRSPLENPSQATRRQLGMNDSPPAYTPSIASASSPTLPVELGTASSQENTPLTTSSRPVTATSTQREDPYSFLATFDTTLLIDDSGSMAGRSWREVSQALSTIAPIVTKHDSDGIDLYFLNHKSINSGAPSEGIAAGGYRGIKRAAAVTEIFEMVRPQGGTPTGIRVHNILTPYLAKLRKEIAEGKELKPLNLIVLTDGVPSDDVESVLLSAAKKLDKLDAPPFQVGVQFFQVGNEEGAKQALEELDDGLSALVDGGVRDIVDTVTWTGGAASSEGGVGLTADGILKAVLGAVVKRLDRGRASGEVRRS